MIAPAEAPGDPRDLLRMTRKQLDAVFAQGSTTATPDGTANGLAIILPGTILSSAIARFVSAFVWKGKTFDARSATLVNRISAFGFNAIRARVYESNSWFDHRPCIVLDYSKTSLVARPIRDEIRAIGAGRYLGKVYFAKLQVFGFYLQF